MYENQIHQIANILAINLQRVKRTGILEGTLGVALFLYEYSRKFGYDSYSIIADNIVEYTIDNYLSKSERQFSFGVFGIGWTMHTLKENRFIEIDKEAFSDIDKLANLRYSNFDVIGDLNAIFPLFSLGLYCIKQENEGLIEKAISALDVVKTVLEEKDYNACYVISIIYFLQQCLKRNLSEKRCKDLLNHFLGIISIIIKKRKYNRSDIYIMQKLLAGNILLKELFPIEVDYLKDVYCNWQTVIYMDEVRIDGLLQVEELEFYMKSIECDIPDSFLGLNGLSSLGLNLIRKM